LNISKTKEMVLGAYLSYGTGHHAGSWRMKGSEPDAAQSISYYTDLVQRSEKSLFDFMFLSDTPSVFADDLVGYGSRVVLFEPLTLLSALAMKTEHIGLISTSSTTYKEPFNLAREYASLDHISGGRAGWNMVTSSKGGAAANFSDIPHPDHDKRYDRAEEFYSLVCQFWNSWEKDAFPRNKETGKFYDPSKRNYVNFNGKYFHIENGLLNVSRPVQGRPVIVQAGSSEKGRELAAATAEIIFTAAGNIDDARSFYKDIKERAKKLGRDPNDMKIMPGFSPYTGSTTEQAEEKYSELQKLVAPELALSMLSDLLGGFDLSSYDMDGPLPKLPASNGNQSRREMIEQMSLKPGMTIRKLYERLVVSRGHFTVIGSYQAVADEMIEWIQTGAADGFNIMPPQMPDFLDDFATGVIPILQKSGWFKSEYREGTLREKLGLKQPE
jgi:FMN-dependent oxidoreductase (nitrilotriacetate monooxygenase family)